jgi:hypothetical protein
MPDQVRKYLAVPQALVRRSFAVVVPRVPVKVLLSAATLASFGWLLAHGLVHPIVVYALQLYLSF